MTQKDVVGDYITRNMLSKIENGSATPSMKTLEYLADVLGLPAGYFLTESTGDEFTPGSLAYAREYFRDGKYTSCITVLEGMQLDGGYRDEALLLLSRAESELSKQAVSEGRFEQALHYADAALEHNSASLYASASFRTETLLLIARCTAEQGGDFLSAMDACQASYQEQGLEEFYRLTMAEYYISQGDTDNAGQELAHIARLSDTARPAYLMLQGKLALAEQNYEQAIRCLEQAETLAGTDENSRILSSLYAMLEQCYRETDDFKKAYQYASMQLQIGK